MNALLRPAGRWWPALLLVVVSALVYWPGRHGGFVLDDQQNIERNPALQAVRGFDPDAIATAAMASPASGMQRPLSMLSFALNYAATGPDPAAMKTTNIAIHAFNAVLVLLLARRLLALLPAGASARRREWTARFAAAAWAFHPIQATAVLYVVQRMESLSHTFVLAGLWLYLVGRGRQLAGRGGTPAVVVAIAGFTGLGVLAKESAALLPLYALALELCVLGFRGRHGAMRPLALAHAAILGAGMVAAVSWLLPRVAPGYALRDFTMAERLLTEPRVLFEYLRWIIVPDPASLGLYHDDIVASRGLLQPATTLPSIIGIAVLVAGAWWLRGRRPLASLGIAWFLAAHVLTASFIPLELAYEHRNYFASLGVCLVAADLLLLAPVQERMRRLGALVAAIAVLILPATTLLRASEWRSPHEFALHEAARRPASPRAQYEKARRLVELTGYRADSPLLDDAWRALERARDTPGSDAMPYQAALVLASLTGADEAPVAWWQGLQERLRAQPLHSQNLTAVVNLGDCAANGTCDFPVDRMLAVYGAALSHGPQPTILASYGKYALHVLGDEALALRLWTDAVAGDPGNAQFRYNLARLQLLMGLHEEAQVQIDELARRGPIANRALVADLAARRDSAR